MAHSYHHAESSARKFGGVPEDYIAIHTWFDATKAHSPLPAHRALRHHAEGIFEAERVFGVTITNQAGRGVPVRFIGEQHVREDCRRIPTLHDWLKHMALEPWMVNGVILPDQEYECENVSYAAWRAAVVHCQTHLGYAEWCQSHMMRGHAAQGHRPRELSAAS
jgi:hypothetical protein